MQFLRMTTRFASLALLALALSAPTMAGGGKDKGANEYTGALKDAWLDGKVETAFALNQHLNPFNIDTEIRKGVAHLTGMVETDIDRDLAGEVALSVDGIESVNNELVVVGVSEPYEEAANSLFRSVEDATTTAAVKTRLLANGNTRGLDIDVDTDDRVVTLSGRVGSSEERDLAEALAMNSDNVVEVRNRLDVSREE